MTNKILIVEDEVKLATLLFDYFALTEYEPVMLHEGNGVVAWVKEHQPCAILLDLMLPGKNGIDICKEIRLFTNVPILMITAKVDEIDRLLGLELGADDYICKPFSPREVVARTKAVLRRTLTQVTHSDMLRLDSSQLAVLYKDHKIELTAVEFQLLKPMVDNPQRIFSREQLMQNMYSDHRIVNNRTIDSHIKKIRKKLADISDDQDWIQSVYGTGYRLALN